MRKARNCCTTTSIPLRAVICSWVNGRLILLSQGGSTGHATRTPTAVSRQLSWHTYNPRQQGRFVAEVTLEYMFLYFSYVNTSVYILPIRQTANVFARQIVQRRSRVISNAYVNQFLHKPTVENVYVVFILPWAEYG